MCIGELLIERDVNFHFHILFHFALSMFRIISFYYSKAVREMEQTYRMLINGDFEMLNPLFFFFFLFWQKKATEKFYFIRLAYKQKEMTEKYEKFYNYYQGANK